jgi:hypothetical protein
MLIHAFMEAPHQTTAELSTPLWPQQAVWSSKIERYVGLGVSRLVKRESVYMDRVRCGVGVRWLGRVPGMVARTILAPGLDSLFNSLHAWLRNMNISHSGCITRNWNIAITVIFGMMTRGH